MAERKPNRIHNMWEDSTNTAFHKTKTKANHKEAKVHFAYADSPYMQPLLPLLPKQIKYFQKKPTQRVCSKINRSTVNAVSKPITLQFPDKKSTTGKQQSDQTFKQRPITSLQCQITLKFIANHSAGFPGSSHRISVQQQHCGGNPVFVYQGWLRYGDKFSFVSRRQQGFPFSVTVSIDNILNLQLSACCEYKYHRGCKLGGGKSQFVLLGVLGSFPCYRCQMIRNQVGGSIASTQSSENSKVDDSKDSKDERESNDCESPNCIYEDDFEEEIPKHSSEVHLSDKAYPNDFEDIIDKETFETEPHANQTIYEENKLLDEQEELLTKNEIDHNNDDDDDNIANKYINGEPLENSVDDYEQLYISADEVKTFKADLLEEMNDTTQESNTDEHQTEIEKDEDPCTSSEKENSLISNNENTTNDEAEQTVTSNTEFSDNSDTDDDVCYSYETTPASTNQRYPSTLTDGFDRLNITNYPTYSNNARFDSSDEEEMHHSPQITIWADVHACEIESPRISKIGL